jgi:hypothetical protein
MSLVTSIPTLVRYRIDRAWALFWLICSLRLAVGVGGVAASASDLATRADIGQLADVYRGGRRQSDPK